MKKILFSMLLVVLSAVLVIPTLFAQDVGLVWDAPTTNEDGSPLTDLSNYKVYYNETETGAFEFVGTTTGTTYTDAGRTDGQHCYYVTAVDTAGNESLPSNTVCTVIDTLRPGSPTNLRIN